MLSVGCGNKTTYTSSNVWLPRIHTLYICGADRHTSIDPYSAPIALPHPYLFECARFHCYRGVGCTTAHIYIYICIYMFAVRLYLHMRATRQLYTQITCGKRDTDDADRWLLYRWLLLGQWVCVRFLMCLWLLWRIEIAKEDCAADSAGGKQYICEGVNVCI